MDHTITIATRQAPIDTLEPPTMGTLYRWECSCGTKALGWRANESTTVRLGSLHVQDTLEVLDLMAVLKASIDKTEGR